ncbi:hypothetical protein [Sphingomonas sp. BAUL-RG-20F-R05-02]|uniref:hypothetical protein n=1 Tax=Sphingomonas sp. BAUL-RG-20F-R05-02 TaxID=2914830 RepID=UPI001F56D822|nr:hypothetical protein [Sphingomonas sp. BAUL-RG-20F-R05-02]
MRGDRPTAIKEGIRDEEALIFFAQRLEELSSPASLDSFRAPTVNIPSLLMEAVEQASLIANASSGVPSSSINPIIEELTFRLSGNIVSSGIIPADREVINKIRAASPDIVFGILMQLKQELSGWAYATQAMHLAIELLATSRKTDIEFLATEIVTTLVNLSMSRRFIHEAVTEFFWGEGGDLSCIEDVRQLYLRIFPQGHTFNVCFRVTENVDALHAVRFEPLGISVLRDIPAPFDALSDQIDLEPQGSGNRFLLVQNITALDRHSAIAKAQSRVSLLKNMYRMYNHDNPFVLYDEILLEQCCEAGVKLVRSEGYVRRAVSDSSERLASRKLTNIMKHSAFLKGRHYEKFVSVSEFHGLSMDSESLPNKLLNTWISLETICPSKKGSSKIESVISGVIPCVGLKYIDRIFSSLTYDLLH